MNKVCWIILLNLSVLVPSSLLAQTRETPCTTNCRVPELVRPEGWEIPGIARTTVKVARAHYNPNEFNNVFVTILEPQSRAASIVQLFCVPDSPGRLTFRDQPVDVDKIWQFEKNGRVFAYRVETSLVGIDGKKRYPLASSATLLFYDPDGLGRFTVMRYADVDLLFKLVVPDWVNSLK